jgi:hypothetical protein
MHRGKWIERWGPFACNGALVLPERGEGGLQPRLGRGSMALGVGALGEHELRDGRVRVRPYARVVGEGARLSLVGEVGLMSTQADGLAALGVNLGVDLSGWISG